MLFCFYKILFCFHEMLFRPPGGGHSLKICDGYVRPHWPHFQTACHWMTPFLFFTVCHHLMTPIFKKLSDLMTPLFRNIYRWKWASCSCWMTPTVRPVGTNLVLVRRVRANRLLSMKAERAKREDRLTDWGPGALHPEAEPWRGSRGQRPRKLLGFPERLSWICFSFKSTHIYMVQKCFDLLTGNCT